IRFDETVVRAMGRNAAGVKGISLRENDEVVSMEIIEEDAYIHHVTNKGIGKRTPTEEYRRTNRGGKGYFVCKLTEETGEDSAVEIVRGDEDIMLITAEGALMRITQESISTTARSTEGVRLIRLQGDEEVSTVAKIIQETPEATDEDAEDEEINPSDDSNIEE